MITPSLQTGVANEDWNSQEGFIEEVEMECSSTIGEFRQLEWEKAVS